MPTTSSLTLNISGAVISSLDCSALQNGNAGCGIRDPRTTSYGPGFNANGGGVYASMFSPPAVVMKWFLTFLTYSAMGRQRHLCVLLPSQCHSGRHHRQTASPRHMGSAHGVLAYVDLQLVPVLQHAFADLRHDAVVRLRFLLVGCWSVSHAKFDYGSGDWASGVWGSSGITGQEQSCAQRTGFSTCEAFVQQTGSAFQDACTSSLFLSSPIFAHSIVTQIGKSATSKYTSHHHNRYQPSSVL